MPKCLQCSFFLTIQLISRYNSTHTDVVMTEIFILNNKNCGNNIVNTIINLLIIIYNIIYTIYIYKYLA